MIEWRSIVSLRALGLVRHAFASHVHPRRAQKPSSPSHEMNAQIISRRGRFPLHRPGLPGLFSFALPNGLARADRVPRFGELRRPQCRSPQRHIRTRLMSPLMFVALGFKSVLDCVPAHDQFGTLN
jgi:hypothetical protein